MPRFVKEITRAELTAELITAVRSFLSRLPLTPVIFIDWIETAYGQSPNILVGEDDTEIFVHFDCLTPSDDTILYGDYRQAKNTIEKWLADHVLTAVPDYTHSPRYYESGRERALVIFNALFVIFPELSDLYRTGPLPPTSSSTLQLPSNDNMPTDNQLRQNSVPIRRVA